MLGVFLVLQSRGLIADAPWWVFAGVLVGAALLSDLAGSLWPSGRTGAAVWWRTGLVAAGITAVMYTTGWGPMLAIGYAWLVGDQVRRSGSRGCRPALVWSLVCLFFGQITIEIGLAPTFVATPRVHGLAVLSAVGLFIAVRLVEQSTRAREQAETDLRHREERFESLLTNASDVIIVFQPDGVASYVSPAFEWTFGERPDGEFPLGGDIVHPDDLDEARAILAEVLEQPEQVHLAEVRLRDTRGDWHWFEVRMLNRRDDPAVGGIVANLHDVTERKLFEEQLTYQAYHDPLTGLPNRFAFLERVSAVLDHPARSGTEVAVLFLDIDRFKLVNDSLGHEVGDRLLVELSERVKACVRPSDFVARLGGDEFTMLLTDVGSAHEAIGVARRILELLKEPVSVAERELVVTGSIGIALAAVGAGTEPSELLRHADLAMYLAKERGRARAELYDAAVAPRVVERLELEGALWRAVDEGELIVHFQPEISLEDGEIVAVEALVRWDHPQRGVLYPDAFLPVAEESTLIVAIDRYVLREACRQLAEWDRLRPDSHGLRVSVNLSPRYVHQPEVLKDVLGVLHETGVDPHRLQVEITERTALAERERTGRTLHRMRDRGIRVAIDDFGTGYSSLSYLRHFPVDVLKLDKSFIDGIGTLESGAAIVEAVITMGHALGMRITAEGVERAEQVTELRALGCDAAQGFHFARPLAPRAMEDLLDGEHDVGGKIVRFPLRRNAAG
ncbi:MAG TPA: EAL domain-containing protein [Acidimicrobiia bacterium]|nr:EAL domain-containing protein [Acidimicrobiia bacterium]